MVSMVLYGTAHDAAGLVVARVFQGLVTGASVAAIGAAMIDLDKTRGAVANAVAPPIGTGSGAMLAGIFVQFLPAPSHLIYEVLGVVFIAQAIGLSFMCETITPRSGVWKSLKPQLALPRATREPLLLAVPVLVAVWGDRWLLRFSRAHAHPRLAGHAFAAVGRPWFVRSGGHGGGFGAAAAASGAQTHDDSGCRQSGPWRRADGGRHLVCVDHMVLRGNRACGRGASARDFRDRCVPSCRLRHLTNGQACCRLFFSSVTCPWGRRRLSRVPWLQGTATSWAWRRGSAR